MPKVDEKRLALSAMQAFWFPWLPRSSTSKQLQRAALGIAGAGMAPVHRRAVANAKLASEMVSAILFLIPGRPPTKGSTTLLARQGVRNGVMPCPTMP